MYRKILTSGYVIQNTQEQHAKGLEMLQKKVFPNLSKEELFKEDMYHNHIKKFPEGQFVILEGDKVIGMTSTMLYHYSDEDHTFLDFFGTGNLENHDPNGDYLYGLDVGIDSDYRGNGLARAIYRVRQELVRNLNLKGQITVGMLNGYHLYKDSLTIDDYYEKVKKEEILDPTVSVQRKFGFEMIKLIKNYLKDPTCGNAGVLMVIDSKKKI